MSKILKKVLSFVLDIIQVIQFTYAVALGKCRKRLKVGAYPALGAIATAITGGVIVKLFSGSFIATGCAYFIASLEKHIGILWASEGDWSHWMSGGRYLFFKAFKEELIEGNGFAQFLSGLNGSFFTKALQVAILFFCMACMIYLIYVFCVCFARTVTSFVYYLAYRYEKKNSRRRRSVSKVNRTTKGRFECKENSNIIEFPNQRVG